MKDDKPKNTRNVYVGDEIVQINVTRMDAEGNLLSTKLMLDHKMNENIQAPVPLRTIIFDRIVPGMGSAPEMKMKKEKKVKIIERYLLVCVKEYIFIAELSSAPTGINFGQVLTGA